MASFKPCYKWNTFNTSANSFLTSINSPGFKPCYKWNTFNTQKSVGGNFYKIRRVLNLVIRGIPSIQFLLRISSSSVLKVLNLVISGIPSIRKLEKVKHSDEIVLNLVISGIPSILYVFCYY